MASGAPHLCYWRLGRLDRHTPRANDPATWRNMRHLEFQQSGLRRSATRGIRHDTQHGKSMQESKHVKTVESGTKTLRPSCSKHCTPIPTEHLPVRSTQTYADEVQRRTHCWPSHHGKMAWGLQHRHHAGLFCWGCTSLAINVFNMEKRSPSW